MKFKIFFSLIIASITFTSCSEDFLDKQPEPTASQFLANDAVKNKEDLQRLLISSYDVIANTYGGQVQNLGELLGDNNDSPVSQNDYLQVFLRRTDVFNGTLGSVYRNAYITIYRANQLIIKKDEITDISEVEKNQLEAESRFLRAFTHHGILRLFAQPAGFTQDNSHLGIVMRMSASDEVGIRSTVAECYDLILGDLDFAEANLPEENGIYATKWAAKALKARIFLDLNDYSQSAQLAGEVINSNRFALLDSLNRFTAGPNSEQIFATVSYNQGGVTDDRGGVFYNYRSDNNANPTMRTNAGFYSLLTSDTNDLRGKQWVREIVVGGNSTFGVARFDRTFMWIPLLHLTEMKLTSAEALAALGTDVLTAQNDLNDIRNRAGLGSLIVTGPDLLEAIRIERRKELCFEGDRSAQIKRFGVLGQPSFSRGAPWDCAGMVLQFPGQENTVVGFILNPTGGCN
ncbi:MAG: RagB/SusD family nutrient uptake outer membrane protein [Bacteroidia bacterium]